jgi:hypothetical protein
LAHEAENDVRAPEPGGSGRLVPVARRRSKPVAIVFAGEALDAFEGESLLCAILRSRPHLRRSDVDGAPRAGFCLMGACEDCWVWLSRAGFVRACTTPVAAGMEVHPAPPETFGRG